MIDVTHADGNTHMLAENIVNIIFAKSKLP